MTIWTTNFEDDYKSISNSIRLIPRDKVILKEVVEEMGTFIGTRSEYEKEFNKRYDKLKEEKDIKLHNYNNELSLIIKEWKEVMKRQLQTIDSQELFDIVYEVAYEEGHAYGFNEVEIKFENLIDSYEKVYKLGNSDGMNALINSNKD